MNDNLVRAIITKKMIFFQYGIIKDYPYGCSRRKQARQRVYKTFYSKKFLMRWKYLWRNALEISKPYNENIPKICFDILKSDSIALLNLKHHYDVVRECARKKLGLPLLQYTEIIYFF